MSNAFSNVVQIVTLGEVLSRRETTVLLLPKDEDDLEELEPNAERN
jgi:hypothetical protein